MASVNKVTLIGNLGRDPEVRYSASGSAVANLAIATTRNWKDKTSGEKQEETEWHRVVFYDRLAEIAGEYIHKGDPVYVEGRLKTRKWQNKEGQDVYTTEVIVENLQLLGQRREKSGSAPPARGASANASTSRRPAADAPAPAPQRRAAAPASGTAFDDMPNDDFGEIPF